MSPSREPHSARRVEVGGRLQFPTVVHQQHRATLDWDWVPPGGQASAAGYHIPGGMIYVGRHVGAPAGETEPALINPDLPVARSAPPPSGRVLVEAPAYHLISPTARAAYLDWLAGGRRTAVPVGLVLLFCFGLERRVLLDAGTDPAARRELPAITAEVRRLRARYGDGGGPAFRNTMDRFLDLLELLGTRRDVPDAAEPARPPASADERAPAPMALRVALARFAATATPVPVAWARTWTRHHPSLALRAAQLRCPEEFDRLFTRRYLDRYGAGLVLPGDVPGIRLRYSPASPGLTTTLVCREDLPDVLSEPRSTRALGALVDGVAAALEPYSRWLARFPEGRGSLAAATLLPAELIDRDRGSLGALRAWAEAYLDGRSRAVVEAAEFAAFWSVTNPHRMARDEAAALAAVLALIGIGIEPDVRFGAPPPADGPAVLFRLEPTAVRPDPTAIAGSGARFRAAAAIARCVVAVVSAAGPVDPQGAVGARVLATVPELAMPMRLHPSEAPRLAARLAWLLATRVKPVAPPTGGAERSPRSSTVTMREFDRLGRLTATLSEPERDIAGRYLVSVAAAADPAIGPVTVAALIRVYQILRLDQDQLFRRLHGHSLGTPPDEEPLRSDGRDDPVVIRPADPVAGGYPLPWTTAPPPPAEAAPTPREVRLDRTAIARKVTESAEVASLLPTVFDADGPAPPDPPGAGPAARADGTDQIPGLDRAHNLLLRVLAARHTWTRDEFAVLAGAHGILPDGALDVLNEAAIETAGAPLIDGDATLAVNDDVLQELLG